MAQHDKWTQWSRRPVPRRRALTIGGSLVAAGAFAAACGGGDDTKTTAPSSGAAATTTGAAPAGTQAAAPAKAPTGKITVVMAGLGTQDYDPALDKNSAEVIVNAHAGEALAIMGPEKNVYIPGLATKWTTAPDGLSWIFDIRKDVKFHDLTTVTPEDIKFSIERFTDPASKPVSGARLAQLLDGIQTTGEQVTLKLKMPEANLIPMIASCQITPKAAVQKAGADFGKKPVGAGPFKFVSATKDSDVTLEVFEGHYRKVAPYKTLVLRMVPEVTTRLAALQTGEADLMLGVSGPAIPAIEGNSKLKLNQVESTSMNGIVFADLVNKDTWTGSKWADVRVRQAAAHAIDQKQLIEKIYFKKGVPVAIPWAVPGIPGIDNTLKPYEYNPQKAKELLSAAGFPNGFEIQIYTYNSGAMPGNVDCAQAIGGYLEKIGIKNTVNPMEYASFLENQRAKKWAGTGALMVVVQGGRAGESFQPSLSQKGSTPYYYDAALEELADKQAITADPKEREKINIELSRKLYEQVANVPLVSSNYMQGLGDRIKAWVPRMKGGFDLGMEYIELKA